MAKNKLRILLVVSFTGDKPELLWVCTGIIGRLVERRRQTDQQETNKYWEVNNVEEDLRINKRTLPERIVVPFLYYWENPDFEIPKKRFSPVFSMMNNWMDIEKKGKIPPKSAYGHATCFQIMEEEGNYGFFSGCFTLGKKIKVRKGGYLDGGRVYVADFVKLRKERPVNKASLETLEISEELAGKTCLNPLEPDDKIKVIECIKHFTSPQLTSRIGALPLKERIVPPKLRYFLVNHHLDRFSSLPTERRWPLLLARQDFESGGRVYDRYEVYETREAFFHWDIVVLQGWSASGKTTVITHVGYKLDKDKNNLVFLINPRTRKALPEAVDFYSLQGKDLYILVDDVHMEQIRDLVEDICDLNIKCKLLIGMRWPSAFSNTLTFLDTHRHCPFMLTVTENVRQGMISRVSQRGGLSKQDIQPMLDNELLSWKDDLLNLAFGLQIIEMEGKLTEENLMGAVRLRVTTDYLGRQKVRGAERVFLPLCIFYQYGIPVKRDFIESLDGVDSSTIDRLVDKGEVIEERAKGRVLSLQHPSLATLYFRCFLYYSDLARSTKRQLMEGGVPMSTGAFCRCLKMYPEEISAVLPALYAESCTIWTGPAQEFLRDYSEAVPEQRKMTQRLLERIRKDEKNKELEQKRIHAFTVILKMIEKNYPEIVTELEHSNIHHLHEVLNMLSRVTLRAMTVADMAKDREMHSKVRGCFQRLLVNIDYTRVREKLVKLDTEERSKYEQAIGSSLHGFVDEEFVRLHSLTDFLQIPKGDLDYEREAERSLASDAITYTLYPIWPKQKRLRELLAQLSHSFVILLLQNIRRGSIEAEDPRDEIEILGMIEFLYLLSKYETKDQFLEMYPLGKYGLAKSDFTLCHLFLYASVARGDGRNRFRNRFLHTWASMIGVDIKGKSASQLLLLWLEFDSILKKVSMCPGSEETCPCLSEIIKELPRWERVLKCIDMSAYTGLCLLRKRRYRELLSKDL